MFKRCSDGDGVVSEWFCGWGWVEDDEAVGKIMGGDGCHGKRAGGTP